MSNTRNNRLKVALALAASVLIQACSYAPIQQKIDSDRAETDAYRQQIEASKKRAAVTRFSSGKVAGDEMKIKQETSLPAVFDKNFVYISVPRPLPEILGEIGRRAGYPVRIQPAQSGQMVGAPFMPQQNQQNNRQMDSISVDWNGSLKGLLDHLAMRSGKYWKLDSGHIYFYDTETKTFYVNLPQGVKDLNSTVGLTSSAISSAGGGGSGGSSGSSGGSSGGAGGGGAGSAVSVTGKYAIDAFAAVQDGIYSILGIPLKQASTGQTPPPIIPGAPPMMTGVMNQPQAHVAVNPALGTVTVTGSPVQLAKVEEYINSINERFAQNILIDLKVYNVDVKQGINAGAALNLAYANLAGKYNASTASAPLLQPDGTPGTLIVDYTALGSRWAGSKLTLQALQSIGDVTLRTSGQVIAANGQPTPLQVAAEVTYLASSSTSVTGTAGTTTTSLVPGVKTVGLTANFLPMILGDNRILLQYQINLSNLISIAQISSGGQTIQMPNVATQTLSQQAYVKDGQAIVLFGFEQDRNSIDTEVSIVGASKNGLQKRQMMVIVMEVYSGSK